MANSLGIYFGPKVINLVESKGRKIVKNIAIPRAMLTENELEEKLPDEVKIVAVFNDELRRSNIQIKEASITLSGRDLIVRTFELPVMPANELASAANFEARKYIPFKVEDLVSDFQAQLDRGTQKNLTLFVGIKKETLEKYLSILKQLNIKVNFIDYSGFSMMRFLRASGLRYKGVTSVISVDLPEEEDANFTVLEHGFPVFSRDITLAGTPEGFTPPAQADAGTALEKLKTEIRVSLDYYQRKFPAKRIENVLLISDINYRLDLESFIKDLGLNAHFVDVAKYIGKAQAFSLGLIKGCGASLARTVKGSLRIDLLAQKEKVAKRVIVEEGMGPLFGNILQGVKINFRVMALGIFICILAAAGGFYRTLPMRQELGKVIGMRPVVPSINPETGLEALTKIDSDYKEKIKAVDNLVKNQLYFTEPLDIIPRIIPEDIWLNEMSFQNQENRAELTLKGFVYLGDSDKELRLLNAFMAKLKENAKFNQYFKEIGIVSVQQQGMEKINVTGFTISCRSYK